MRDSFDKDDNFPLTIDSRLIEFLQTLIKLSIKVLAILMTGIILWSIIDVGYIIYQKLKDPPYLLLDIEDILGVFGAFLAVLIAIEIFLNIILYLKKEVSHVKLVVATALMAISRKIIIIDYDTLPPAHLYGIAAIVLALGITYWFLNRIKKIAN